MTTMKPNRRGVFKLMLGGLGGIFAPRLATSESVRGFATPKNGDEALKILLKGNNRYLNQEPSSCSLDAAELRKLSEDHQQPFAAILSCSDSRVPVELIFDQGLGQLFVVRVAGNVATTDTIASLEYAAAVLEVKLILVVGHTSCGAIKAASANKPVPGQVSSLFQYMGPAVRGATDLNDASRKSAVLQAVTLAESSPVLAELVETKKLLIRAATYDVGSGKVDIVETMYMD